MGKKQRKALLKGIHKLVRKAELILRNSVGMVRYGWDDGYLLGKKKKVFQALE